MSADSELVYSGVQITYLADLDCIRLCSQ